MPVTPAFELETPVPLADLDRLERNLDRMAGYVRARGLALRPHAKTHKATRIAQEQLARGAVGMTCATPRELEVMGAVSHEVLLAHPPVSAAKLARLMALPEQVQTLVALDSAEAVERLGGAAQAARRMVGVLVELDLGMHRVGVVEPAHAVALAQLIDAAPALDFAGVLFYPGHLRGVVGPGDPGIAAVGRDLGEVLAALDGAGLPARVVSGGSTPTAWVSHEIPGLTEIRPGTYVYNDRATIPSGACTIDDCALTVLATVVSTAVPGQAVIDAGSKALGREPRGVEEGGFGELLERPEVTVRAMSEEHGILDLRSTAWRPRVGEQVRVVPNHVCVVVHLHDRVIGVREDRVVESWVVEARGR